MNLTTMPMGELLAALLLTVYAITGGAVAIGTVRMMRRTGMAFDAVDLLFLAVLAVAWPALLLPWRFPGRR
ncbi:hypothetical protein [Streptomyces sp. NPDC015125]|uniref:hypothetical protein n=1 Tax=Streptomyces sp. NPDC015125 TaxID=3364938 RepID=UPI0036FA0FFB